jgi:PPOX class probable F420-dependent enzyme
VTLSWVDAALTSARVGRLATVGEDATVRLVPICFAVVEGRLVSAVDHKPKRTAQLQRLRDIASTGRATVLVDHYDEDWSALWWIRVSGPAAVHERGSAIDNEARRALVTKYEQYHDRPPLGPVYSVTIADVRSWRASPGN